MRGLSLQDVAFLGRASAASMPNLADALTYLNPATIAQADNTTLALGYVWEDSSGNGNSWTHGGDSVKAVYRTSLGPNGRPAIQFNDATALGQTTGPYFSRADLSGGLTEMDCFVVIKLDSDPPVQTWQTGLWQMGTDTANVDHTPWTDGTIYQGWGLNTRQTLTNPATSFTNWTVYNISFATNGDYRIYINNNTASPFYSANHATKSFPATWRLGREVNNASNNYYLKGLMSEFVFFNRVLTPAERTAVYEYLTR